MPRYFFDTADGDNYVDQAGTEMPTDTKAREEAVRYLGALLVDNPGHLPEGKALGVSVRTEAGTVLMRVEARDFSLGEGGSTITGETSSPGD